MCEWQTYVICQTEYRELFQSWFRSVSFGGKKDGIHAMVATANEICCAQKVVTNKLGTPWLWLGIEDWRYDVIFGVRNSSHVSNFGGFS